MPRSAYALVSGLWLGQRREVCKTVGSAYVGSNPTPATTCENGPFAANSRAGGPFLLCPVMCHLVALRTVMLRCPRTHSGRASVLQGRSVCAVTTVGVHSCGGRVTPSAFHGRPRTSRADAVSGAGRVFNRGRRRPAYLPGTSADPEWDRWPCYALRVTGHLRWLPAFGVVEISGSAGTHDDASERLQAAQLSA